MLCKREESVTKDLSEVAFNPTPPSPLPQFHEMYWGGVIGSLIKVWSRIRRPIRDYFDGDVVHFKQPHQRPEANCC